MTITTLTATGLGAEDDAWPNDPNDDDDGGDFDGLRADEDPCPKSDQPPASQLAVAMTLKSL